MGNRIENVENIMKKFNDFKESQTSKASEALLKEIENRKQTMEREEGILQAFKEELEGLDTRELDHVQLHVTMGEYKRQIEKAQKNVDEYKKEYDEKVAEKDKIENPDKTWEDKQKDKADRMEARGTAKKELISELKEIDLDLEEQENSLKAKSLELKKFKLEYKEEEQSFEARDDNGNLTTITKTVRVPINAEKRQKLDKESEEIRKNISKLKEAKNKCEEYIAQIDEEFIKESEEIKNIYKNNPTKPDPVKPDPVKPDPVKPDPVKPDPVKPGQTESKKELTNDNKGEAKIEGASKDNNTARNTTSTDLEEIFKVLESEEEIEPVKPGQTGSKKELTNDNKGEAKIEGASKDNNTARNTTSTNLEEIFKDLEKVSRKKDIKEEVDLAREQLKELFKERGIEDYENTDLYKDLILKIDVAEMAYVRAGEVIKSNADEEFKKAYKIMQEVNKDYLKLTPKMKIRSYLQERLDLCEGLEKDPDRIKNLDKAMNNILVLKMRDILRPKQEEKYSEIIEESKKVVEEEQIKKISNENSLPAKVESKGIWNKLRNWNNSRKMYATLKKGIKDYDKKVKECDKEVKECDKDSIINTPNDIKDTILGSMLLSKRQKEKLVHMIEHKYPKKEGKVSPETVNTIKSMAEEKKASQGKTFKDSIKDDKASENVVKVGQEHSNDDREKAEGNEPSKDDKSTIEDVFSK